MNTQVRRVLWQSATIVNDYRYNPNFWRADSVGRLMYWFAFGDETHPNGWNIGHITPRSHGGSDELDNLQAEHHTTTAERQEIHPILARKKRSFDPLVSVYGVSPRIQPYVGSFQ
jgi:hypothetical protein